MRRDFYNSRAGFPVIRLCQIVRVVRIHKISFSILSKIKSFYHNLIFRRYGYFSVEISKMDAGVIDCKREGGLIVRNGKGI